MSHVNHGHDQWWHSVGSKSYPSDANHDVARVQVSNTCVMSTMCMGETGEPNGMQVLPL